jgi:hypothetical protein
MCVCVCGWGLIPISTHQGPLQQSLRTVTKNEIYRLFIREDLLRPLANALKLSLNFIFSSLMCADSDAPTAQTRDVLQFTPSLPPGQVSVVGGRTSLGGLGSTGSFRAHGGGAAAAALSAGAAGSVSPPRDSKDGKPGSPVWGAFNTACLIPLFVAYVPRDVFSRAFIVPPC